MPGDRPFLAWELKEYSATSQLSHSLVHSNQQMAAIVCAMHIVTEAREALVVVGRPEVTRLASNLQCSFDKGGDSNMLSTLMCCSTDAFEGSWIIGSGHSRD